MNDISRLLSETFSKIQYCDKILVASSDGLIITAYPDYNPDKNDSLAASSTSVLGLTAATSELAGKGDAEYVLIRSNNGFMMTLGQQNFSVLVMAGQKANLGMLLLQGQKLVEKLSGIIDEHIAPKKLEHPRIYTRELGTIEPPPLEEAGLKEAPTQQVREPRPEPEFPEQGIGMPAFAKPVSDFTGNLGELSSAMEASFQVFGEQPLIEPNPKPEVRNEEQPVAEIECCSECEGCEELDGQEHLVAEPDTIEAKFWPEKSAKGNEEAENDIETEIEEERFDGIYSDKDVFATDEDLAKLSKIDEEPVIENEVEPPVVDLVLPKGIYINDIVVYSNRPESPVENSETQQEPQKEQETPEVIPWFNFNNGSKNRSDEPQEDEKSQKEGDLFDSY